MRWLKGPYPNGYIAQEHNVYLSSILRLTLSRLLPVQSRANPGVNLYR